MCGRWMLLSMAFITLGCTRPNYQEHKMPSGPGILTFSKVQVAIQINWEKFPTETEMGSFWIRFMDTKGASKNIEPLTPAVVLWMPSMGHGSSPVELKKISDGIYNATRVYFIMPGDWEIRIQLKDNEHIIDEVIKPIFI